MRRFIALPRPSERGSQKITDWYHFEIPLVAVSLNREEYDDVYAWCVAHFGESNAEIDDCGFSRRWYGVYAEDRFAFRSVDDAMLFRIRWC